MESEQNIRLLVAYDGTNLLGWQKNSDGRSVENELEAALKTLLQQPILLAAASRTDAHVHAKGQVVNFLSLKPVKDWDRFIKAVCSLLPKDIRVIKAEEAPLDFHATLSNKGKAYHYHICCSDVQSPFHYPTSWHYPYSLDLNAMHEAAKYLIGEHDFSAFTNKSDKPYQSTIREITSIDIQEDTKRLCFVIKGKSFLYRMVRNLVGTLVYVGRGKIKVVDIPAILAKKRRADAGICAPAKGLTLNEVYF